MSDTPKVAAESVEASGSETTAIRKFRESTGGGPRVQVTYLYGVFGEVDGLEDEAATEDLRQKLMSHIRLVITETGGKFDDLDRGRWSATLGAEEPTEEDPLMAVTIGLKLLRLAAMTRKSPPLRMVTVTGRVSRKDLELAPHIDPTNGTLTGGHELLRLARKIIRESEPGMLCADGLTYQMIRDTHFCHRLTDLPGTLSNIPIYEVHSAAGSTNVTYDPPLCGREDELKRLEKVFERVERGEGPVFFTITGDLGIGKSRLARAFVSNVRDRCALLRNPRERRRIDRWRRIPYSYFGEILRSHFEIIGHEEPHVAREKLLQGIDKAITAEDREELPKDTGRYLGLLCQVPFPEDPTRDEEDPAHLESRAFAALSQYLELASRNTPILFVMEDLYSADGSSLRLLQHLTEYLDPARILFLCVSRLDLLTELEQEANLSIPGERLILSSLKDDAARRMILQLLPDELDIPETLCDRILGIADGNPFFLRESLRDLAEQGLFEALQQGDIDQLEIPQNIEGILQARISRLSSQERDVLQKAAVFGKSFWRGGVEMLYRQDSNLKAGWRLEDGAIVERDDDLEPVLEGLVHKGVLQYQSSSDFEGDSQYNFVPSLLYEIAYNEIPQDVLAPYHLLVGQWLELMAARRNSDIGIEIAHHFDLGGAHEHAAKYHIEIGTNSLKMYATERAIDHLEKGLKHLAPQFFEKRCHGLRQLAEAYILNGQYQEAIGTFQELLDLSWKMGQRVLAGEVFIRMGWVYFLQRDFDNALKAMKNGHTLHQETLQQRGIASALSNMGQVYMVKGDYQRARLFLQEALETRRDMGHPGDLAWALNNMGNLLLEQGDIEAAKLHHKEALEIRKQIGNPHLIIRSTNNLALINLIQGNYDAALADLLVSSNLAQKVGEKLGMAVVMVNISELYLLRGDNDQANKYLNLAMQLAEKLNDPLILAECYRLQGEILLEQEDWLEALECCHKAHTMIVERDIRSSLAQIYRLMGEIYAALPPHELEAIRENEADTDLPSNLVADAIACYEESIALAYRHGNLREEAKSRMMMGIYEVNRGKIARGRYQLERAQAAFEQLGMQRDYEEVTGMLKEIDDFQSKAETPDTTSSQASLRPPRSKMANVDKTMVFMVTFDDDEVGPPPTPAMMEELALASESDDEDTIAGTIDSVGLSSMLEQEESSSAQAPDQASPNATRVPTEAQENAAALPPQKPLSIGNMDASPRPKVPREHTMEVQSPVYSITGDTSSKNDDVPEHTLSIKLAVSSHSEDSEASAQPAATKDAPQPLPTRESPTQEDAPQVTTEEAPKAYVEGKAKKATTLKTEVPQSLIDKSRRDDDEEETSAPKPAAKVELKPSPTSVEAPSSEPTPLSKALTEDLDGGGMDLETMDVVDTHKTRPPESTPSQTALPKAPPFPAAPGSGTHPVPPFLTAPTGTTSAPSANNAKATVALQSPKRQSPPPPPGGFNSSAPTREIPSPKRSDGPTAPAPSQPTANVPPPASPPPVLPSEMDFLNMPVPKKKPSVYDSQVIIAQVAEDDDVSLQWFSEGRSDQIDQFWKERSEELDEVHEEMAHQQLVEELDQLDEGGQRGNALHRLRTKINKDKE